jgi:membrane protein YdbS with pleckstrin-like domain
MCIPVAGLLAAIGVAGLAAAPLVLLGVPWGRAAHRRAGFGVNDETATIAKGVLVFSQELVALERLQSAHTTSSPLQRRVDLASLHLDVAGMRFAPNLGDMDAVWTASLRRSLARLTRG